MTGRLGAWGRHAKGGRRGPGGRPGRSSRQSVSQETHSQCDVSGSLGWPGYEKGTISALRFSRGPTLVPAVLGSISLGGCAISL